VIYIFVKLLIFIANKLVVADMACLVIEVHSLANPLVDPLVRHNLVAFVALATFLVLPLVAEGIHLVIGHILVVIRMLVVVHMLAIVHILAVDHMLEVASVDHMVTIHSPVHCHDEFPQQL